MSHPYSQAIFEWHLAKVWDKRKKAETPSEIKWWNMILELLHADFLGKEAIWRGWKQNEG